jgi:signal transduction histidine kinase
MPISSHGKTYGNIVICFKHEEHFPEEKKVLCTFIGNVAAQAITIRRLMESEKEKAKIEFLAEATHELRTPLAIIKGNVDLALIANSKNEEEIKKTLHDINYEVDHMSEIVADLSLLLNSGASFRRKILSHEIKIDEIVKKTVQRFGGYASKRHVSLHVGAIPNVIVSGDRVYLEKMFGNVIKNAITYGKKNGSVTIGAAKVAKAGKRGAVVHIDIVDNGIGIPKKDISHIFERFYRADNAREKNHEGTGLGLAIVKFIAEAHEGSVSLLKSQEKKGSTFRLTLPILSA